jgi:hypothetical protein
MVESPRPVLPTEMRLAAGGAVHRLPDRENVGFNRVFRPTGVHRQHGREAMAVLLGHQQGIAANHQVPAHGGVPRHVGFSIPNGQSLQGALPAPVAIAQVHNRCARLREEQVEHSGGHARSADIDRKSDHLEYDIETVKLDGTSHKVKISGLDGTVIKDESDK